MSEFITKLNTENSGLAWKFQVNPDSCENPKHYEDYIRLNAITDQNNGRGTTHLLIDKNDITNEEKIIGFITLRASSLIKEYGEYTAGSAALEIAELAVDKRYERRGKGSDLVRFAEFKADELNNEHIGIEYVILCADSSSVEFYSKPQLKFDKLLDYYEIPREGWNRKCTPMFRKLPNI